MEVDPNELLGRILGLITPDKGFSTFGIRVGGFAIAVVGDPSLHAMYSCLCLIGAIVVGILLPSLRKVD